MHVIVDSTGMVDIPPETGGGVEAYVWDVARVARGAGHEVTIVSNLRPGAQLPDGIRMQRSGSFVDRFPLRPLSSALAHGFGGVFTARATRQLLRANGHAPTLLHLNEEVSAAILASRYPDLPKVFTIHNPPPIGDLRSYGIMERTVRWINSSTSRRLVWSQVDVILALSSWIRSFLIQNGVAPERVVHLPVPIDTEYYAPHLNGSGSAPPYFLYVGRLDARKNVLRLMDAMATRGNRHRLILVGRGPASGHLDGLIRRHDLSDRVSIRSRVSSAELLALFQGATAFCLPSTLEAYPRVVLEAAACGVPAILPSSFLYQDFHAQGFVESYDPRDAGGLLTAIDRLADDPQRRRTLAGKARAYSEAAASYRAFGAGLLDAYQRAMAGRAAR